MISKSKMNMTQPDIISKKMFPHQLTTLSNMERLEREQRVDGSGYTKRTTLGIVADIAGYGKTLSCVALIARDKIEWDANRSHVNESIMSEAAGLVVSIKRDLFSRVNATLILCSSSILSQWRDEISCSNLRMYEVVTKKDVREIDISTLDVVLVIPSMFNELVVALHEFAWKRFIFDEPGHVRVASMRRVVAGFTWFVTANPGSIARAHAASRGSYMKDVVESGYYDEVRMNDIIIKNQDAYVRESYSLPPPKHHYHYCRLPLATVTHGLVNGNIASMIEAGDIDGALSAFGARDVSNLLEFLRNEKSRERQEILRELEDSKELGDASKTESCIERLDTVKNQEEMLEVRCLEWETGECAICLGSLKNPVLEPKCHNIFCASCILKWITTNDKCPLCRNSINHGSLIHLGERESSKIPVTNSPVLSTKHDKVIQILDQNSAGRYLIYSQHDASFNIVTKLLDERGISYRSVKGTAQSREESIQDFYEGKTQILFLNATRNAAGINLQVATDIILYHHMAPVLQSQILGRALRIGRDPACPLNVHHLLHKQPEGHT